VLTERQVRLWALIVGTAAGFSLGCGQSPQTPKTQDLRAQRISQKVAARAQSEQEIELERLWKDRGDQLDLNHPLQFEIRDGHAQIAWCSERIVEVPFVLRNLPYPFRGKVLDVGYRESEIIYETASLGFETWGIDLRPPLVNYPGVRYVRGDIRTESLPRRYFNVVIVLSTVEHIGLMAYGNEKVDIDGDLHALQAIHGILKPSGRLLLTVPFGQPGKTSWYRVYDYRALHSLLTRAGFRAEIENFWLHRGNGGWAPVPWTQAQQINSTEKVQAVACVVASLEPQQRR